MNQKSESGRTNRKRKERHNLSNNGLDDSFIDYETYRHQPKVRETGGVYSISDTSFFQDQNCGKAIVKDVEKQDAAIAPSKKRPRKSQVERLDHLLINWIKEVKGGVNNVNNVELSKKARSLRDRIWQEHVSGTIAVPLAENELQAFNNNNKKCFTASKGWTSEWKKKMAMRLGPYTEGAKLLLGFYSKVESLAVFDLQDPEIWSIKDIPIGDAEGEKIAGALNKSANCKKLAFSNNRMTPNAFKSIGQVLQKKKRITYLSVHQNDAIRGDGILLISKLTHLTRLQLWDCKLDDSDAIKLAGVLRYDHGLIRELILTRNNIGAEGADAIADAASTNTTLKCLSLDSNCIGSSATQLHAMLRANRILERLHLEHNMIGDELCHALSQNTNSAIHDLMLGFNGITDKGAIALAIFLENSMLRSLRLRGNKIGDDGARVLALFSDLRNHTLQLDIDYDTMTTDGMHALQKGTHCLRLARFPTHDRVFLEAPPVESVNVDVFE